MAGEARFVPVRDHHVGRGGRGNFDGLMVRRKFRGRTSQFFHLSLPTTTEVRRTGQGFVSPSRFGTADGTRFSVSVVFGVMGSTNDSFFCNDLAPYFGRIESITLQPYDFQDSRPHRELFCTYPALTKFAAGHDARIGIDNSTSSPNSITVQIEFSDLMDCNSVTRR